MANSKPALGALLVFFAMLWMPLGQQAFLAEHWMKVGTFAAPLLLFMAFSYRDPQVPLLTDTKTMAVLLLAAYLAHQFEEHWVDVLGRVYPLREELNVLLRTAFGDSAYGAMTPQAIFIINTSVVWLIGTVSIWRAPAHVFPALAMAGVVFVNGLSHLAAGLAAQSYNAGLLTSAVLFVPLSAVFFRTVLRAGQATWTQVIAAILWGVGGHAVLVAGLLLANVHGLIPVGAYYAALVAYALTPLLFFRPRRA